MISESKRIWLPAAGIFLLALGLRLLRIGDIYFQFDEWLGGWHGNPPLAWEGSLAGFLSQFWANTRQYVTSGQTIAWSGLIEIFKLLAGPGVVKVRVLAALGGAFGAGAVTWIARRIYPGQVFPALAAGLLSACSVAGIVFGQFADVYASAVFASSLQLVLFVRFFRFRPVSKGGCLAFFLGAAAAQALMYTQVWLTAALVLTAAWDKRRSLSDFFRAAWPGAVFYAAFSGAHLWAMGRVIPWSESFRWYMAPYYPAEGGPLGPALPALPGYFLGRLYDFFSYHWAAVFHPGIYLPLSWNWVLLPFLIVLAGSVFFRRPREGANWIPSLAALSLLVCLAANFLRLMPFGGIRQTVFLNPVMSLLYAWAVFRILGTLSGRLLKKVLGGCFCFLAVFPLGLSWPGIYRDRVSRVDLDFLFSEIEEGGYAALVCSEQNIQILELALRADPRVSGVNWPGYRHPADALDADFQSAFPELEFVQGGKKQRVLWVTRDYFPPGSGPWLWADMHISAGSRFEGEGMKRFYPDPAAGSRRLETVRERPGNAPDAVHQSLYWAPNSFYLYRVLGGASE